MRLLSLSGMIPEQVCDVVRFTSYKGCESISHYCGYASDYISQVIEDDNIDGAVFPRSCDSSRIIGNYLKEVDKFIYHMNIPARQDDVAIDYLSSVIKDYKDKVEKYYDVRLRDIDERSHLINCRNKTLSDIYENIHELSYEQYIKNIHMMLKQPLKEQRVVTPCVQKAGKKIYIVGSFLSNADIIRIIESAGLCIVGDNLTESKRLFSAPVVEPGKEIYHNISKSILHNKLSPSMNNFRSILMGDLDEIKKKDVKGVIYITQKYCEPYDYMYSVYKKMLDENGIPLLRISSTSSSDTRISELAIEAFEQMI